MAEGFALNLQSTTYRLREFYVKYQENKSGDSLGGFCFVLFCFCLSYEKLIECEARTNKIRSVHKECGQHS